MSAFQLAVSSEMVFTDLPILDRVRRIHDLGFAVEIWSWHDKDLEALRATGATFTSMTGVRRMQGAMRWAASEMVSRLMIMVRARLLRHRERWFRH